MRQVDRHSTGSKIFLPPLAPPPALPSWLSPGAKAAGLTTSIGQDPALRHRRCPRWRRGLVIDPRPCLLLGFPGGAAATAAPDGPGGLILSMGCLVVTAGDTSRGSGQREMSGSLLKTRGHPVLATVLFAAGSWSSPAHQARTVASPWVSLTHSTRCPWPPQGASKIPSKTSRCPAEMGRQSSPTFLAVGFPAVPSPSWEEVKTCSTPGTGLGFGGNTVHPSASGVTELTTAAGFHFPAFQAAVRTGICRGVCNHFLQKRVVGAARNAGNEHAGGPRGFCCL